MMADAPKGTGELVAASFGASLVEGRDPRVMADRLVNPTAQVRIERL